VPTLSGAAPEGCWHVEKLVPGGDGMARLEDGRVAFVSGAFPGDVVSPANIVAKKGYVRAEARSVVRPSPLRVEPACPIAARCGGCDWMALERAAQLEHKGLVLRDALERTGRFGNLPAVIPVAGAGPDLAYRARVRFHIDATGAIGFHAKKSHALVEVEHCLVCRPEIDRALTQLRKIDRRVLRMFSSVEVRSALEGTAASLRFEVRPGSAPSAATRVALAALPKNIVVTIADEPEARSGGEQSLELPGGVRIRALPGVFTQVNPEVNALLVANVVDGARARGVARFCDLFAGVGNFTLPLLAAGMTGRAVERDARAVESARHAAQTAGLAAGEFVSADAAAYLAKIPVSEPPFDLVIMDPPRRGAKELLADIVRLVPRHVAMCSCDPVTFARDLATLAAAGYELGDVRGFDMFPQTHHLEALAWMERKAGRPSA
jgi:23S rRNA (uracil1939-C5)-methyltransferase